MVKNKKFNVFEYFKLYNTFKNDKRQTSPLRTEKTSIKRKKNTFDLLKTTATRRKKISVILRDKNFANVFKTANSMH